MASAAVQKNGPPRVGNALQISPIARATVAFRSFELRSLGIELLEHYSQELPLIVANREEIQQVVLNLLLNAEQAVRGTGRSGIVRIRTGETDTSAFVEVADDGPGVPAPSKAQDR